jgi:hypothetical protein
MHSTLYGVLRRFSTFFDKQHVLRQSSTFFDSVQHRRRRSGPNTPVVEHKGLFYDRWSFLGFLLCVSWSCAFSISDTLFSNR